MALCFWFSFHLLGLVEFIQLNSSVTTVTSHQILLWCDEVLFSRPNEQKKKNQPNKTIHDTQPDEIIILETRRIFDFYEYKYDENEANLMLPHI